MTFTQRLARLLLRPRNLVVIGAIVAAAATAVLVIGGHRATAGASSASAASASYAALASDEPSGLPLVTSHGERPPGVPAGPTWPAQPPEGSTASWPLASSIRRVPLGEPGLSGWIATSIEGGICVLLYDGAPVEDNAAIYSGCSAEARLDRGASVEVSDIPGKPAEVIAAGVVPDGVTAVSFTMADGSTDTVPVRDNAWARVGDQPAASGKAPTLITGG
jgi:hypothetical protein